MIYSFMKNTDINNFIKNKYNCPVCGGERFISSKVLCSELITDWKLDKTQTDYIDHQQGYHCADCNANLRSMTLASSIMKYFRFKGLLNEFVSLEGIWQKKYFVEINESGTLTPYLQKLKNYKLFRYPESDMMNIKQLDNSIDIIVHSDTLEHIADSTKALKECHRVLKKNGAMIFTIPIIHERLTEKRCNLKKSYHGCYASKSEDYVVYTEYGSDFYTEIIKAGFQKISLQTISDLSSIAVTCEKD